MKDEIKEIIDKLEIVARKHTIEVCDDGNIETMPANVIDELRIQISAREEEYMKLQEENERLKDIRNQAITYNKVLCKIYDCGIELSNAETNLCILRDEETINLLQGKSDE